MKGKRSQSIPHRQLLLREPVIQVGSKHKQLVWDCGRGVVSHIADTLSKPPVLLIKHKNIDQRIGVYLAIRWTGSSGGHYWSSAYSAWGISLK